MIKFEVHDMTKNQTNYRKIAESMDEEVFNAEICLYDIGQLNYFFKISPLDGAC